MSAFSSARRSRPRFWNVGILLSILTYIMASEPLLGLFIVAVTVPQAVIVARSRDR